MNKKVPFQLRTMSLRFFYQQHQKPWHTPFVLLPLQENVPKSVVGARICKPLSSSPVFRFTAQENADLITITA